MQCILDKERHVICTCIMYELSRCNLIKIEEIQARQHMQHETNYHTVKHRASTCDGGVREMNSSCRLGTSTSLAVAVANLESLCLRRCGGPPTSPNLLFSFLFSDIAL